VHVLSGDAWRSLYRGQHMKKSPESIGAVQAAQFSMQEVCHDPVSEAESRWVTRRVTLQRFPDSISGNLSSGV
jgi:hypothetical protein